SKVAPDNLVADVLDVRPRPRGSKRPQAHRRSEDPVDVRPYRNDWSHRVVKRQRLHPARRRNTSTSPASGEAGQAQSGKRARLPQKRPTIHGASPDVRREVGTTSRLDDEYPQKGLRKGRQSPAPREGLSA